MRVVCARRVDHRLGGDRPELAELIGQHAAGLVVADQTDEDAVRSERGDVARDVAGAADLDRSPSDVSTGVGASGEMRVTSP